jgi:hypothetical protein
MPLRALPGLRTPASRPRVPVIRGRGPQNEPERQGPPVRNRRGPSPPGARPPARPAPVSTPSLPPQPAAIRCGEQPEAYPAPATISTLKIVRATSQDRLPSPPVKQKMNPTQPHTNAEATERRAADEQRTSRRRPTASTPTDRAPLGGSGGSSPRKSTASPRRSPPKAGEHRATPGGYGGKPPGVAIIGVPTGARNAGSDAPTGDQSIDMNRTRKHPPVCQDPITTRSRDEPEQAQSVP